MHERRSYFDVHEANALIPKLDFYFAQLARIQREVNKIARRAEQLGVKLSFDAKPEETGNRIRDTLQSKCAELANEYADIVDEVHEIGVVIEDPDVGTVNFYSWVDGEEVILSWQYGESEIAHWFRANEDFMARRPLTLISSATASRPPTH